MARIRLAEYEDLPSRKEHMIESVSSKEDLDESYSKLMVDPKREIWQALGRNPEIMEAFRNYSEVVRDNCNLNTREQELTILTISRELDSEYEWHQHVRIALKKGLKPDEIRNIATWGMDRFNPKEQTLIHYVRGYVRSNIDDKLHDEFVSDYDEETAVGLGSLVNIYVSVAQLSKAFDLQPEEEFVGWDLSAIKSQ